MRSGFTVNKLETCQRQKMDDNSRQSSTVIAIYVGIEPIGGRAAERCWPARSERGLTQGIGLSRK